RRRCGEDLLDPGAGQGPGGVGADAVVLERGQLQGGAVRLQVADEGADDDPVAVPGGRAMGGAGAAEPGGELAGVQLGGGGPGPTLAGHAFEHAAVGGAAGGGEVAGVEVGGDRGADRVAGNRHGWSLRGRADSRGGGRRCRRESSVPWHPPPAWGVTRKRLASE